MYTSLLIAIAFIYCFNRAGNSKRNTSLERMYLPNAGLRLETGWRRKYIVINDSSVFGEDFFDPNIIGEGAESEEELLSQRSALN